MRDSNVKMFKETMDICGKGYYQKNGNEIHLKLSRDEMKNVQLFSPDTIVAMENDCALDPIENNNVDIRLSNKDSFEAALDIATSGRVPEREKVLVLNFANPVNPGGGVKNGAKAQEEDLCRKSTLYYSLTSNAAVGYYSYNRKLGDLSSDYMMISPEVEIIRDTDGKLLDDSVLVSVITAAAPISRSSNADEVYPVFRKRIQHMFKIAALAGYRYLVLGAWGCGAFGNDAEVISKLFNEAVQEYKNCFLEIEFAVYGKDRKSYNYRCFKKYFNDGIEEHYDIETVEEMKIIEDEAEISAYDPTFPLLLFKSSIRGKIDEAKASAEEIYRAVLKMAPEAAQIHQEAKKGFRLVVDVTDKTLSDIESGKIKLTVENGNTYAQLKNGNVYGTKLPIKKEYFSKGIDPVQMSTALQMAAMQEQIQTIAAQLTLIDQSVHEVLQGQQSDRLGLYYSGLSLYLEAREIRDAGMKRALIAQALRALAEAYQQLIMIMRDNIEYLESRKYESAKGDRVGLIDSHMSTINQCFQFIHQSALLRSVIYCEGNEMSAMSSVLDQYANFIRTVVVKSSGLLAQCDMTDDGTEEGVWKKRAQLKLEVSEASRKLKSSENELYLSIEGTEE